MPLPLFRTVFQPAGDATTVSSEEEEEEDVREPEEVDEEEAEDEGKEWEDEEEADVPAASPPTPTHDLDAAVDRRTLDRMYKYHRHQREFQKALLDTPVEEDDELRFLLLFATGPHRSGDRETPVTFKRADDYEQAADIVRRNRAFRPNRRLLQHLRRTIRYREKAQKWFSRLHSRDARHARAAGHWAFIDILKRVYQTLNDGRAYSPSRH